MAATPSMLVAYTIPDRDSTVTVTNRHHFSGGTPATNGDWETLFDAVVALYTPFLTDHCTVVRCDGFAAGSDVAVHSKAYSEAGDLAVNESGHAGVPGFVCALIRWSTTQRTTKNHPIYLYSYVHGLRTSSNDYDGCLKYDSATATALDDLATAWDTDGISDGTNTYYRAGPNGAVAQDHYIDPYFRDHDLSPR